VPQFLQDITFVSVVVVGFIAFFRLANRVEKWRENRSTAKHLESHRVE
jgi:hypothetical protein